ncbi:hypothetical protein M7I_4970 [Glarea lozoyensis 74030]|uniref:Aminotransferase class I/classII domain-containing protein n=1 Tax=Glarea lozoyensis (strain ATCC 74030 / MF5533) TaxID=1104152 RepID=H0EQL6_GLAL7|nr:hypothetical protein M7I_4970 [Glarea lozoyensis 74030]
MGDAIPPLTPKKEINLLRGWPHFSLLPVEKIKKAMVIGAVPEGDEGVDLEYLRKKLETEDAKPATRLKSQKPWSKIYRHIIYCVPTFSNPSGKTMSLTCHDVYDSLLWSTTPSTSNPTKAVLPRLIDVDRTLEPTPGKDSFGNAMSNGSFSKIAGPGVRTGWAEASPKFIYGLNLPSDINAEVVSLKARQQENLIVAPGKLFEVYGDESVTFPNSIRLCFSFEEEKDLAEGVERLGNAIKA